MIYRIALYRFKADIDEGRIEEMNGLRDELAQALHNERGVSLRGSTTVQDRLSPGGMRSAPAERDFTHGWIVEAENDAALQIYIDHPIHTEMISKMDCLEAVVVEDLAFND